MSSELPLSIERLKQNVDIADVARRLGLEVVGRGDHYRMTKCPFHEDRTPSMALFMESRWYHCFGCGEQGDVIDLVKRLRGCGFREAVAWLGGTMPEEEPRRRPALVRPPPRAEVDLHRALELALNRYGDAANRDRLDEWAKGRGIPVEVLENAGVVAVDADPLASQLVRLDREQQDLLLEAGLLRRSSQDRGRRAELSSGWLPTLERPYDFYRDRIIFPVRDLDRTLVGFTGRDDGPPRTSPPPKYLSSLGFRRSQVLYRADRVHAELSGPNRPKAKSAEIFVVEGLMDALRLESLGLLAVAVLGASLTDDQVNILVALARAAGDGLTVHLFMDSDDAGRTGRRKALHALLDRSVDAEVELRVDVIDVAACVLADEESVKDPDGLLRGVPAHEVSERLRRGLFSPADVLLSEHLAVPPGELSRAWERATTSARDQACGNLIRTVRQHRHRVYWRVTEGAVYRAWWEGHEQAEHGEWVARLVGTLHPPDAAGSSSSRSPSARGAPVDPYVALKHAMRLGEASAHRREVPFDKGSWERIRLVEDAFLHPLAEHLRHLQPLEGGFAALEPYSATLTPKDAHKDRLKAMPGPEDLVLQQYLLLELLKDHDGSGFEQFIPAVRYQVTRSDGPKVWTTGRGPGDERDQRVVSFAYQVDMDVLSGNRPPGTSGVFRHWYECWQHYRQEIQRQLRPMEGRVWAMSLDIRSFYDAVRWTDVRNRLFGALRDALEALGDGGTAEFAPLFCGDDRPDGGQPKTLAGQVIDWLRSQASDYKYYSPKDGSPERAGADGIGLAQGPDLSAYLANVLLFGLDARLVELVDEIHNGNGTALYARYVDDMVIAATSRDDMLRLRDTIEAELGRLGLRLKPEKSEIFWGETAAEIAWRLDRDFVPSGVTSGMPPVDGFDPWAEAGPARSRREALQILRDPALFEATEKVAIKTQLRRAAQAPDLRAGDFSRIAELTWWLVASTEGPPPEASAAAAEYVERWMEVVRGVEWARDAESNNAAWTLRHYLTWLEGIDHALEKRGDRSPRLSDEASRTWDSRQLQLADVVLAGFLGELRNRLAAESKDRTQKMESAEAQLSHAIWLRRASIMTSAAAVRQRSPEGREPVDLDVWVRGPAIRRYQLTIAQDVQVRGQIGDVRSYQNNTFGGEARAALLLHEALVLLLFRRSVDSADPLEPLSFLWQDGTARTDSRAFDSAVRALLEVWRKFEGTSADAEPAQPWQLSAFLSAVGGGGVELIEHRPRLWGAAFSDLGGPNSVRLIPSPPGADVRALLGLTQPVSPPRAVVAVEYVGPSDEEPGPLPGRPSELAGVEGTPSLDGKLRLLSSSQAVNLCLLSSEELRRQLEQDGDRQIAWLLTAFESLAESVKEDPQAESSNDHLVAVPTSANLLVKPQANGNGPPELTGRVLGYRVSKDRVKGQAFVRSSHGGLRSVAVPGALADYWRIGVALADALGEWHGLADGGLERLRAPNRAASDDRGADQWAAREMLRLSLVRLTGRGQVRNDFVPREDGRLPRTIERTLHHMRRWPQAHTGTEGGASARMAHLLAMHVGIAAATHRSAGDPPPSDQPGGAAMFLAEVGQRVMPDQTALIQNVREILRVGAHGLAVQLRQTSAAWWGLAALFDTAGRAIEVDSPDTDIDGTTSQELRLAAVGLRILSVNATLRAMVLERLGLMGDREALWKRLRSEVERLNKVWLSLELGDTPLLLREPTRVRRRAPTGGLTAAAVGYDGTPSPTVDESLVELLALVAKATGVGAPAAEVDLHVVTPLGWLVLLACLEDPVLGHGVPLEVDAPPTGESSVLAALARDLGRVALAQPDDWPWLGAQALMDPWSLEAARGHFSQLHRLDERRGLQVEAAEGVHPPLERGEAETGEGMVRVARPDGGTQLLQRWQVSIAGLADDGRSRRPLSSEGPDGREVYHWTVTWARSPHTGARRLASVTFAQPGLALAGGLKESFEEDRADDRAISDEPTARESASSSDLPIRDDATLSSGPAYVAVSAPDDPPGATQRPSQPNAVDDSAVPAGPRRGASGPAQRFRMPPKVAAAQSKSLDARGQRHRTALGGRSRLRVALFQWEVDDSYRHPVTEICLNATTVNGVNSGPLRKDPSGWDVSVSSKMDYLICSCAETRRRALLEKALDLCGALGVELLVLPEYSVRPETVDWLQERLGGHSSLRAILAGTFRVPTWPETGTKYKPGAAMVTLLHRESARAGEGVRRFERPKVFAANALGELIHPTENPIIPLYLPDTVRRDDLMSYVCELVCAESFAATSPANLPSLADDMYHRWERFGLRPMPEAREFMHRTVKIIASLGQELSPENLMRRSIVLVPAMTTRTVDYAVLGQASFLAAGITTVLCSAAVHGFKHGGGSCFVGYDSWNERPADPPGMPRSGPYHGALPGLWRHGVGGGIGSQEQALVVADIDPIHSAERKTRGQGQAGPPLELVAHVPFIELPPAPDLTEKKRPNNPCRCARAAWDAREQVRLAPARDLHTRLQKLADQMKELVHDSDTTTMNGGKVGGSAPGGAEPVGAAQHGGTTNVGQRTQEMLDALARLVPSSPALKERAKAYREHHASSLQAWPPPALLDWAVVDPWGDGAKGDGTGSGGATTVKLGAPPFAELSDDALATFLGAQDQE